MLPKEHRITSSRDYSTVMRHGARAGTSTVVVTVKFADGDEVPWRCGFVVSKAVGNAVVRHRTTRRLRHLVKDLMAQTWSQWPDQRQVQVVVRALSQAPDADHQQLHDDLRSAFKRALKKAYQRETPAPGTVL